MEGHWETLMKITGVEFEYKVLTLGVVFEIWLWWEVIKVIKHD